MIVLYKYQVNNVIPHLYLPNIWWVCHNYFSLYKTCCTIQASSVECRSVVFRQIFSRNGQTIQLTLNESAWTCYDALYITSKRFQLPQNTSKHCKIVYSNITPTCQAIDSRPIETHPFIHLYDSCKVYFRDPRSCSYPCHAFFYTYAIGQTCSKSLSGSTDETIHTTVIFTRC